ncbi:MAG: PTS sugar transporter subunit IIA [Candidatus Delongbacteria bacterium]|nr:PTS sugar transporter subunit IIA [Candidatus Delongbacteria bacterium]MBN2834121.1 PTS sugar transporter subunit IIA [Candidatus Delongbacteria bacterium]
MFLGLEEAAGLLSTNVETLKRWVRQGSIISHRIGDEVKFDVDELRKWSRKNKIAFKEPEKINNIVEHNTPLIKALENGFYFSYNEKRDFFDFYLYVASKIAAHLPCNVSDEALFKSFISREKTVPTVITANIAIPHPKITGEFGVEKSFIFLVKCSNPIKFPTEIDEESREVSLFFFILSKDTQDHIKILANIARICSSSDLFIELNSIEDKNSLLKKFYDLEEEILQKKK